MQWNKIPSMAREIAEPGLNAIGDQRVMHGLTAVAERVKEEVSIRYDGIEAAKWITGAVALFSLALAVNSMDWSASYPAGSQNQVVSMLLTYANAEVAVFSYALNREARHQS